MEIPVTGFIVRSKKQKKQPTTTGSFFVLSCISYTYAVNIITLSGTHHKKEPLSQNGSAEGSFSGVCSFLYIVDMTAFLSIMNNLKMYKKLTFYTYAKPFK